MNRNICWLITEDQKEVAKKPMLEVDKPAASKQKQMRAERVQLAKSMNISRRQFEKLMGDAPRPRAQKRPSAR